MLDFSLSIVPLAVLTLVNFVLSWVWYSPLLFAKPWMKALGMDGKREMSEEEKKAMPWLFLNGIVSSFILVFVLQVLVRSLGVTSFFGGLILGVLAWAGFALTHSLNTLWEGRKPIVLVINNGLFLLSYAVYAGLLAVWR